MDPVSIGLMLGSTILSGMGAFESYGGAQDSANASIQIAGLQQQENAVRQQSSHLQANRLRLEDVRNAQRARSLALTNATSKGAQYGSAVQGGYGQISGESGVQMLAINQNLELSDKMFALSNQISQQEILKSRAGGKSALGQGLMALGGDISKATPELTRLAGNVGGVFSSQPINSDYYQPGGYGFVG